MTGLGKKIISHLISWSPPKVHEFFRGPFSIFGQIFLRPFDLNGRRKINAPMRGDHRNHTGRVRASVSWFSQIYVRGWPCKDRPLDFRPKTEFLQIFCVRQLVHMINENSNNLALSAIFNIFGDDFRVRSKTVKIVLFRVKVWRCAEGA